MRMQCLLNRFRSAETSPDSSPLHISSSQSVAELSSPLAADAAVVAAAVAAAQGECLKSINRFNRL